MTATANSMCGWTVWPLIGLWRWWGLLTAELSRLESRGYYFYCSSAPSYHNSCPHISCLSAVRNSQPISILPLSALLFHSPLCVSCRLLRSLRLWPVFDLIGDLWGLFGYRSCGITSLTGRAILANFLHKAGSLIENPWQTWGLAAPQTVALFLDYS